MLMITGGNPWDWLQNSGQRRVRVVELGSKLEVKMWYPRPHECCLGTTLAVADTSGSPSIISLVPLLDHRDLLTKKVFLSSSVQESKFNTKADKHMR
jgi:hypothetical protein